MSYIVREEWDPKVDGKPDVCRWVVYFGLQRVAPSFVNRGAALDRLHRLMWLAARRAELAEVEGADEPKRPGG